MTLEQCISKRNLDRDIIENQTYEGLKMDGFSIVPSIGNTEVLIRKDLLGKLNLAIYPDDISLDVFVIYDLERPITELSTFKFEPLDFVLQNLDDNSF